MGVFAGFLFYAFTYIFTPLALIFGWVKFAREGTQSGMARRMAPLSFAFATASALLAVAAIIYSAIIGGFPFYDPRLLRIYRYGILLALASLLSSFIGLWKPGPLRWLAPVCAFGTLVYWFGMAVSE